MQTSEVIQAVYWQRYRLDDRENWVRFPAVADFSILNNSKSALAFIHHRTERIWGLFLHGLIFRLLDFDPTLPHCADVRNKPLVAWILINYSDDFAFSKDDISKEVLTSKKRGIAPRTVGVVLPREWRDLEDEDDDGKTKVNLMTQPISV